MSVLILAKHPRKDIYDIDTDILEDDVETEGCGTTILKVSAIKISTGGLVSARNVLYMPLPSALADTIRLIYNQSPGSSFYSGRLGVLRSKLDKPNLSLLHAVLKKGYAEKEAGTPHQPGLKALAYIRDLSIGRSTRDFEDITDDLVRE